MMSAAGRESVVNRWNTFWFSGAAPHIYAVLRILFGMAGLVSLVGLLDLPLFWSCDGLVASRTDALCAYLTARGIGWLPGYSILSLSVLSFAAMVVGFRTRIAVCSAFASVFLMARWNDLPLSGAHQLLRALLFCLVWADCGRVWSVDGWLRTRKSRGVIEPSPTPIWPLQLIRIQVAAVYLITGLWKLDNVVWRDGSALHYVFENPQFRRFPVLASPALDVWTTLATYGTLGWELAFAFLVIHSRTRRWALAIGVVMHLGMWVVLELGPFSWIILASYVAFFDPEAVKTVFSRLGGHPSAPV